jgi:DNA-binding CsgD family transcriptional regulator/tetratricopeptide (TPR) repeat protein
VRHFARGGALLDRRTECRALDDLLSGAAAGRSSALLLRGEAGIGKSELIRYVQSRSEGCRVIRAVGVQSEMELSYAGLQQLCLSLLGGLSRLPELQRAALETAFGLRAGPVPDRFLVGLATLNLLAQEAEQQPLVCLVDDAQWLDQASALTLGFVARRILAESIVLILAVRDPAPPGFLTGLSELTLPGLPEDDCRKLLDSAFAGSVDEHTRDRVLAEARGNPLALLELPRVLGPAAGVGGRDAQTMSVSSRIEQDFVKRIQSLSRPARILLFTAATESVGDAGLLIAAAGRLGIDVESVMTEGGLAELLALDTVVRFRHPIVRSAAIKATPVLEQKEAHRAIADSMDRDAQPDRYAWHLAQSISEPDEDVATTLEMSAHRAQERGGLAATGAFLELASQLTPEPERRSQRALGAAQALLHSGQFERANALLAAAEAGPGTDAILARVDRMHAEIAFAQNRGNEATAPLLAAATRLARTDPALSRQTYLEAVAAAIFAGRLAGGPGLREVGEAARHAPQLRPERLPDRLLDALAVKLTDGYVSAVPLMRAVLEELCDTDTPDGEVLPWLWLGSVIAADLWDDAAWEKVAARQVTATRAAGMLAELPHALDSRATVHLLVGELSLAASMYDEATAVLESIGGDPARVGPMTVAAFRGQGPQARELIRAMVDKAMIQGQGAALTVTHWSHAVLCNGLAEYGEARSAALLASERQEEFGVTRLALVELVEAAVRSGSLPDAVAGLEQLRKPCQTSGTEWALGLEARSRALLAEGPDAEALFQEAIERLARTKVAVDLARTHLLYGEWLNRNGGSARARTHLSLAHTMLTDFGVDGFAERARLELGATGTVVPRSAPRPASSLTSREQQVAGLAAEGLTNIEIGARLFLSTHTVDWHLRKVFTKLGISRRREIANALRREGSDA